MQKSSEKHRGEVFFLPKRWVTPFEEPGDQQGKSRGLHGAGQQDVGTRLANASPSEHPWLSGARTLAAARTPRPHPTPNARPSEVSHVGTRAPRSRQPSRSTPSFVGSHAAGWPDAPGRCRARAGRWGRCSIPRFLAALSKRLKKREPHSISLRK